MVDQEYEMKPMLGVRSGRLLDKESLHSSKERVGNGDLQKYNSLSMDDTSTEFLGRFFNVTRLSDIACADDNENVHRPSEENSAEEDVSEGDFTEEAPHHKLSVAKSTCSDCKTNARRCKCEDLEARFEEMSSNMQRLENQMGILINLLERSGVPSNSQNQERDSSEARERNVTVTSV